MLCCLVYTGGMALIGYYLFITCCMALRATGRYCCSSSHRGVLYTCLVMPLFYFREAEAVRLFQPPHRRMSRRPYACIFSKNGIISWYWPFNCVWVPIGRMLQMQLIQGDEYESQIYKGTIKTQTVEAARGEITDRYGNPIVTNRVSMNIVLDKAFLPH